MVVKYATRFVKPKANQFGGQRGCSTNHFLAEVWDKMTDHLEDPRAAVILTSIDYSKAFNRLEHHACLIAFAKKGAPNQLLKLLASFLIGQKMTVRLEGKASQLRSVNAGAPQGSVLGTYMFNVGTDALEENLTLTHASTFELEEGDLDFLELRKQSEYAESSLLRSPTVHSCQISPIAALPVTDYVILPTARNVPLELSQLGDTNQLLLKKLWMTIYKMKNSI